MYIASSWCLHVPIYVHASDLKSPPSSIGWLQSSTRALGARHGLAVWEPGGKENQDLIQSRNFYENEQIIIVMAATEKTVTSASRSVCRIHLGPRREASGLDCIYAPPRLFSSGLEGLRSCLLPPSVGMKFQVGVSFSHIPASTTVTWP